MYYIVSFRPPGTGERAAKIIDQAETMPEAVEICRKKENISMSVGCMPFICKGLAKDKYNRITGYIDMLFLE